MNKPFFSDTRFILPPKPSNKTYLPYSEQQDVPLVAVMQRRLPRGQREVGGVEEVPGRVGEGGGWGGVGGGARGADGHQRGVAQGGRGAQGSGLVFVRSNRI